MNTKFKLGDRIRSYDFEPMEDRPDRYLVGSIIGVDVVKGVYELSVDVRVVGDVVEHIQNPVEIYTPIEMSWGDWTGRLDYDIEHCLDFDFDIDSEIERIIKKNNHDYASI